MFVICSMEKGYKKIIPITDSTRTYIKVGSSYYEVHKEVYKLIKLLLKENKRKVSKHERFEA